MIRIVWEYLYIENGGDVFLNNYSKNLYSFYYMLSFVLSVFYELVDLIFIISL